MLRLDAGFPPARMHERDRRSGMLALGFSLGLHGAVFAGLVLFWEAKPPVPYTVIAVELVETGGAVGSRGEDIGEQSPLQISMERESAKAAGRTPDLGPLADSRDQDDRPDAFEAARRNGGSSVEKTTKPAQILAHAPMPENTLDRPEATSEAMRRIPPTPPGKPLIKNSPTDRKSTRSRFEEKLAKMKDEYRRPADQESAREGAQLGADRTATRTQQTTAPALEKERDAAAVPTSVRTGGLGESSGTRPRFSGGGLSNAAPRYPYLARRRGQEGRVVLRVQVSASGDPASIRVRQSSGYPRLDDAAIKAVKTWRFVPSNRGGIAVAGSVDVPVSFKLTD